MVTGHSLGGAVATLAAFDIARKAQELGIRQEQVLCYTFGAPRTGSAAFAELYNQTVPDTWMLINGQVCELGAHACHQLCRLLTLAARSAAEPMFCCTGLSCIAS